MFCPSTHPRSRSPCRNASRVCAVVVGFPLARYPIRHTLLAGCASAASGAARRPPAKVPRNARRSIATFSTGRIVLEGTGGDGQRDDLTLALRRVDYVLPVGSQPRCPRGRLTISPSATITCPRGEAIERH